MKKTVLTFGLISGVVVSTMMLGTLLSLGRIGFDKGVIVGYTGIVLAFMLVFFGIRSYRENVGGGTITFGRAFAVGILITVISSLCYVLAWQIFYYNFMPDFFEKYSAHVIEKARASGATPEALQAQIKQLEQDIALYKKPVFHILFVFL